MWKSASQTSFKVLDVLTKLVINPLGDDIVNWYWIDPGTAVQNIFVPEVNTLLLSHQVVVSWVRGWSGVDNWQVGPQELQTNPLNQATLIWYVVEYCIVLHKILEIIYL